MDKSTVSVVIPSLHGNPMTVESIPDGVELEVVTGKRRSVARNLGAEQTSGDVIVFCDDDIQFEESFFWKQVKATPEGTISGLEDWDFGYLITRFMVVNRKDFERIGGFDERINYMEDTEFCLNGIRHGMSLRTLPREKVEHEEHTSAGKNRFVLAKNTLYLSLKYPRHAKTLISGMVL